MKLSSYLGNSNLFFKRNLNIIYVYVFCCLFIVFIYLLTENTNISVYELVADPNEVGQVAPYTGLVSTIGNLLFCATAAICIFTAHLISYLNSNTRRWCLFLKYSGYFVLLLLADDMWQFHENFYTLLSGVELTTRESQNFGETVVFGIYGLLFSVYLVKFRKIIYQTELLTLALTFIFFAVSTTFDIFFPDIKGHFILEEGFKLLGIVSLLIYYINICSQKSRQIFGYLKNDKNSNSWRKIKQYSSK